MLIYTEVAFISASESINVSDMIQHIPEHYLLGNGQSSFSEAEEGSVLFGMWEKLARIVIINLLPLTQPPPLQIALKVNK